MTQLFDKENIQKTLGKISMYKTTIMLLGPIIAGIIYGFLTLQSMILVFFIMQLISLSSNFFLNFSEQKFEAINERESFESWFKTFWNKISFGYRFILQSDVLKHLLVLSAVINAVGAASFSVLPETIMIKELNFTPQQVGIVCTIFVVGSLVGKSTIIKKENYKSAYT